MIAKNNDTPLSDRWRGWIDQKRGASARGHRKYESFAKALERMQKENGHLSDEQVLHLTTHAVNQNEDGTFSWKFDNHMGVWAPFNIAYEEMQKLWEEITCPTLLCYGADSWASNPQEDGRIKHFQNARTITYENAGHWLHHDQFDKFMGDLRDFL
jgi:pimeloyl-ACP methyl ester carboxylesterase